MSDTGNHLVQLLTPKGREWIRTILGKNQWIVCEKGFLDNQDGDIISDKAALITFSRKGADEFFRDANKIEQNVPTKPAPIHDGDSRPTPEECPQCGHLTMFSHGTFHCEECNHSWLQPKEESS